MALPPRKKPYAASLIGAGVAYVLAHSCAGGGDVRVPAVDELTRTTPSGEIVVVDKERLEWFVDSKPLAELLDSGRLLSEDIALRNDVLAGYLLRYEEESLGSNPERVEEIRSRLAAGEFTRAQIAWEILRDRTSPHTAGLLDGALERGADAIAENIARVDAQRERLGELIVGGQHPFLWTGRKGLRYEALWWGLAGALAALAWRQRRRHADLPARELQPRALDAADLARIAAGPLVAAALVALLQLVGTSRGPLTWLVVPFGLAAGYVATRGVRDLLDPAEARQFAADAPASGHVVSLPTAERAAAAANRRRDTAAARQARADRRRRIQVAMSRLHPASFSELKDAADQFARELATVEIQEFEVPR